MKRLISQNGIEIDSLKEFKVFDCKNCGCKFESNEYEVEILKRLFTDFPDILAPQIPFYKYIDTCFTCKENCIIVEDRFDS